MGDRVTKVVSKSKGVKVVDGKESRTGKATDGGGFKGSVVGAARDVTKGRDEFGGAVLRSVFDEQISKAVEATSLEVGVVVEGRSRWHKKFDGIRRAAENNASESRRR